MNGCRIYNISMGNSNAHILNNQQAYMEELKSLHYNQPSIVWPCSLELGDEFLLNGFFLYSLLLEKSEQCSTLFLPHDESSQRLRLRDALLEQNKQMEGPGQEAYLHACDLCFFVFEGDNGDLCELISNKLCICFNATSTRQGPSCCMRRRQHRIPMLCGSQLQRASCNASPPIL